MAGPPNSSATWRQAPQGERTLPRSSTANQRFDDHLSRLIYGTEDRRPLGAHGESEEVFSTLAPV